MTKQEIIKEIAEIHNTAANINVHGDDAILMAQALLRIRDLVRAIKSDDKEPDA